MQSASLYIHIPFCRQRCSYCDFVTTAGRLESMPDYIAALCREVEEVRAASAERLAVHSVFFGGGTPSLVSLEQYAALFKAFERAFSLDVNA